MRTLYQSECCFYMIKPFKGFFFFNGRRLCAQIRSNESVRMKVFVGSKFELQSSNAKKVGVEELWSLSLKQKPIWFVGKNAQRGEWGRESLVMSICKCLDLVSNQRGWPKVITWYWLWVGHLSCNDFHFLGMGFWGGFYVFNMTIFLTWCLYHCCRIRGLEESPPKERVFGFGLG